MSTPGSNEIINWEYQASLLAQRITDVGSDNQVIVDESTAGTTYVGSGAKGLTQGATGWLLTKIVVSGTTTTITHAIDTWTNRVSATYA